jgi:sugar phosphate isomerase/epimerase
MNHSAWRTPFALALSLKGVVLAGVELGNEINWTDFNGDFPIPGQGKSFTFDDLSRDPEARQVAQGFLQYLKVLAVLKEVRDHSKLNQHRMKPKLAAFPKCYLDELCVHRTMTPRDWIEIGATLGVDGLEFFSGFIEDNEAFLRETKALLEKHGLEMPMMCCSPDFTEPDPELLEAQIVMERRMIAITAFFGGRYCRVLSGQRRPGLAIDAGIAKVVRIIRSLLPCAEEHGVIMAMENHYKDSYWLYPEFAQPMKIFTAILEQINSPWLGVNFDPSNTLLAGEDPLELLERVKHRVVSMHASDRYLSSGTLEDLRKEEDAIGYAKRLSHGIIGKGLNDYDKIFSTLKSVGFSSWISIEDGLNGVEDLRESVSFLRAKIDEHFPE